MIKFFKKVRYNLMETGKTSKYLKYAVGEILLVVIGILIALAANNWNENRKTAKKEITYYNRLISNLNYDISLYKQIMQKDTLLLKSLSVIENNLINNNTFSFKDRSKNLTDGYRFTTNRTTIDNLISSGQIETLRSHFLVENIFTYYRTTQNIDKGIDNSISNYNRNTLTPIIINSRYQNPLNKSTKTEETNINLLNAIVYKKDLIANQLNMYYKQLEYAQKLIKGIQEELNFIEK